MNDIYTSIAFCADLCAMGYPVPDNTVEISIELAEYDKPCTVVFSTQRIDSATVQKTSGWEFGKGIPCSELYNKLSEHIRLPEYTSNIKIVAKANDVVKIYVEAALPVGAFDFLKS